MDEDTRLFMDSFHEWLEKHGMEIEIRADGEIYSPLLDLNELKTAIFNLSTARNFSFKEKGT